MEQETAERIAMALEGIESQLEALTKQIDRANRTWAATAESLANWIDDPKFIPTGFAVKPPEELRRMELLGQVPPGTMAAAERSRQAHAAAQAGRQPPVDADGRPA